MHNHVKYDKIIDTNPLYEEGIKMSGEIMALALVLAVIGIAYVSATNEGGSMFKYDSGWFKKK